MDPKPNPLNYAPPSPKRDRKMIARLIVLVIGLSFTLAGLVWRNAHELIVIFFISIGMIATTAGIFGVLLRMGQLQDEAMRRRDDDVTPP